MAGVETGAGRNAAEGENNSEANAVYMYVSWQRIKKAKWEK